MNKLKIQACNRKINNLPVSTAMCSEKELHLPCDLLFWPAPDKQQSINDYRVEFMERLGEIHQYACQHLKVASDRRKAQYDHAANSTRFLEGYNIWF